MWCSQQAEAALRHSRVWRNVANYLLRRRNDHRRCQGARPRLQQNLTGVCCTNREPRHHIRDLAAVRGSPPPPLADRHAVNITAAVTTQSYPARSFLQCSTPLFRGESLPRDHDLTASHLRRAWRQRIRCRYSAPPCQPPGSLRR